MKAGILYGDQDIRFGDAPDPEIKSNEVLIKSMFARICGTDLHVYRSELMDRVDYPGIQGNMLAAVHHKQLVGRLRTARIGGRQ